MYESMNSFSDLLHIDIDAHYTDPHDYLTWHVPEFTEAFEEECPVEQEVTRCIRLKCNHSVGVDTLDSMLKQGLYTCPLCRVKMATVGDLKGMLGHVGVWLNSDWIAYTGFTEETGESAFEGYYGEYEGMTFIDEDSDFEYDDFDDPEKDLPYEDTSYQFYKEINRRELSQADLDRYARLYGNVRVPSYPIPDVQIS